MILYPLDWMEHSFIFGYFFNDSIAKSLLKYNYTGIIFDIDYIKKPKRNLRKIHKEYNLIFFLGWQLLAHIENDEIYISGPMVMKGYVGETETNGIHKSHDLGRIEFRSGKSL